MYPEILLYRLTPALISTRFSIRQVRGEGAEVGACSAVTSHVSSLPSPFAEWGRSADTVQVLIRCGALPELLSACSPGPCAPTWV